MPVAGYILAVLEAAGAFKSMKSRHNPLSDQDYQALAAYRHALRRFLAFSEAAARDSGLTPQQHQAILAIRGHGRGPMSIGELAETLLIRHHSAVELANRLARADLVERSEDPGDRRRVVVRLTRKAETLLERLSAGHLDELRHGQSLIAKLLERLGVSQGDLEPDPSA